MSIGPVPGSGIPLTLPVGKIVVWSAVAQAGAQQFVQLKNSLGQVIFTAQGAGVSPTQFGKGSFIAADPAQKYTMWIGTSGGQKWSQVLWEEDVLNNGANALAGKYVYAGEDAGDNDFNDCYVELTWFKSAG